MNVARGECPRILAQPELDLEGVEPLSDAERVARWMREQPRETGEVLEAALFLRDQAGRAARAARWLKVRELQEPFDTDWGWLITGGTEAVLLYEEAERSFIVGLYVASLLCSHAACERALAGCLEFYQEQLDRNWRRWGLGALIPAARNLGLIDPPLAARLAQVTELRKVTAHFKPPITPNSVQMRAVALLQEGVGVYEEEDVLEGVLHGDALLALEVATELLRGDQGFHRVRAWA